MRLILIVFLALALGSQAQAAKRVGFFSIKTQSLSFVSETTIPDPEAQGDADTDVQADAPAQGGVTGVLGGLLRRFSGSPTLDLCMLSTRRAVFGVIGFWESRRYVLAPGRCAGDEYYDFEEGMYEVARTDGSIPEDVPARPEWTAMDLLNGFWGIGLALGFFGMSGVTALNLKRKAKKRAGVLGAADTMGKRAGTVMAASARADGGASEGQMGLIRDILNTLTEDPLTEAEVREVVRNTPKMKQDDLIALGTGLDLEDRMDLYQAAVMVAVADERLSKGGKSFLFDLSQALGLNKNDVALIQARTNSQHLFI